MSAAAAAAAAPRKLALVVRTDLGMGRGKVGSQCAHAALAAAGAPLRGGQARAAAVAAWRASGGTTVVLRIDGEAALLALGTAARARGLSAAVIRDAGRTQIEPGSLTVMAIGPDEDAKVDAVTGGLKLL